MLHSGFSFSFSLLLDDTGSGVSDPSSSSLEFSEPDSIALVCVRARWARRSAPRGRLERSGRNLFHVSALDLNNAPCSRDFCLRRQTPFFEV